MHLWLNHIDRTSDRVAALTLQVVHRDHGSHHGIHQPLAHFQTIAVFDRRVGHQVANITHQHQGAALCGDCTAIRCSEGTVAHHFTGDGFTAFFERLFQIAAHQAKPVGVGNNLVFSIDCCNTVFAIHDCGQCGLKPNVRDVSLVCLTNWCGPIDANFDQQTIFAQVV